jgi:hypothetical protein
MKWKVLTRALAKKAQRNHPVCCVFDTLNYLNRRLLILGGIMVFRLSVISDDPELSKVEKVSPRSSPRVAEVAKVFLRNSPTS